MPDPGDAGSVKQVISSMMGAAQAAPDLIHQAELQLIAQLADSVQKCASAVQDMRRDQAQAREVDRLGMQEIRERLIRIEENRVGEDLKALAITVKTEIARVDLAAKTDSARIDALETDRDRRDGATGLLNWLLKYGPALFGLFTVLFLIGRALGVLHIPDQPAVVPQAERTTKRDYAPGQP